MAFTFFKTLKSVLITNAPIARLRPYQIKCNSAAVTCKHAKFNLITPLKEDIKFGDLVLASNGWLHRKSKGDFFIIHSMRKQCELREQMIDLVEDLQHMKIYLGSQLKENIDDLGIMRLTEIQKKAIPKIMGSHHILIAAETGCGKTLAYAIPLVHKVLTLMSNNVRVSSFADNTHFNNPTVLILSPGRELAMQIGEVFSKLCKNTNVNVEVIVGGNTKKLMLNPRFKKVDILVSTMGALRKLFVAGIYRFMKVEHVVLDEADTLLDDTFSDILYYLLQKIHFHRTSQQNMEQSIGTQLILASATIPKNIGEKLQSIIDPDTLYSVHSANLHRLLPHVTQKFIRTNKDDRPLHLLSIVKEELAKKRPLVIFSNKSSTSDYISILLNQNGIQCLNLNGDMLMKVRSGRFEQFQNGEYSVLSTTDVGSRGLDTAVARHVINFDFPLYTSDYIHRCGRVGRIGGHHKCFVTNLISSRREIDLVQRIEHAARTGGRLPNVNANIRNIITRKAIKEMKQTDFTSC